MVLPPLYTADNCQSAYQLNWSLSIFWKQPPPDPERWLSTLAQATECDSVRILEHRIAPNDVSQFLLSTQPHVAPSAAVRSIKGRLQYLLKTDRPKCFRRNYSMTSVGSGNLAAIEKYVATQVQHHRFADPRLSELLGNYQFNDPQVDLAKRRRNAFGEFIHNLHVVLVRAERLVDVREESLRVIRDGMMLIAEKKNHQLSRVGLAADHIHFTIGCDVTESPQTIALGYLNNLAYFQEMKAIFQFGFYVGTFGPFDLQAVRRCLD